MARGSIDIALTAGVCSTGDVWLQRERNESGFHLQLIGISEESGLRGAS